MLKPEDRILTILRERSDERQRLVGKLDSAGARADWEAVSRLAVDVRVIDAEILGISTTLNVLASGVKGKPLKKGGRR